MKFIAYDKIQTIPDSELLVVDSYYPRGLNLTHLYSERVPEAYRSDSSTEVVLKWLAHNPKEIPQFVTCNHWDIDGFLSVWSVLHPELALKNRALLIKTAELGDFRECDRETEIGLTALKLCCTLNSEEKRNFCPPFGDLEDATIEYEVSAKKFPYFIPLFGKWLENIDGYRQLWYEEYTEVLDDLVFVDEGYAHIEELGDIGLSIITTSKPLHYCASFTKARGGAVLTFLPKYKYLEFEYKYETAVGRLNRKIIERVDLTPLAKELTELESSDEVVWRFDNINEGGTMLRPERSDFPISRELRYQNITARVSLPEPPYTNLSDEVVIGKIIAALS